MKLYAQCLGYKGIICMKWIGTSWKMNNDIIQTKRYIDTLIKYKKYLKKKTVNFL